ncbi:hypothetical protein [Mycoplasmopsis agassizii]|uniref:Lipoprotein n=1 Tax=Mycoplasmopsis agassizii TaxID=33922 RepID=A0ABX4H5D3_9BACT|nr:hypothetical protein [Mycoplasmopsis agassizii]PAF54988.1 hypothetical protein CJF60_04625 [Mycoplasmopsis agassizii]SMC17636.1 hypothetical protein SAMN02745179_00514 [Mycoplasmopsis agassizii]
MLHSPIQQYKKRSKIVFWLFTISTVSSISFLVACSQNVEPEKPKVEPINPVEKMPSNPFEKWGKYWDSALIKNPSAAIYEKVTSNKKPFVQLNTFGFKFFTFSDWYWAWYKPGDEKSLDGAVKIKKDDELVKGKTNEKTPKMKPNIAGGFIKKSEWIYENGNKHTWIWSGENSNFHIEEPEIQKNFDTNHKSISLIENEDDLKIALRFDDESWKTYYEYFKSIDKVTGWDYNNGCKYGPYCVAKKDIKSRFLPWSKTFNYPLIKEKMDLKKYNYLFLKDFWNLEVNNGEADVLLDGGITIEDYDIDIKNKNITLDFREKSALLPRQFVNNISWTGASNRLTSFMIPIEKNKLSDFDFNDWTITYKEHEYTTEIHDLWTKNEP